MAVDIYWRERKYIKKFLVESWEKNEEIKEKKNDVRHTIVVKGVELFVVTFMIGDDGGGGDGVVEFDVSVRSSSSSSRSSRSSTLKQTSK